MNTDPDKSAMQGEPVPNRDELLLQRHMDGELRPSERKELDAALEKDASLRQQKRRGELQSEFFQSDRDCNLPPPLALDFADRVLANLNAEVAKPTAGPVSEGLGHVPEKEAMALGPWILAAAVLLGLLLIGQFMTRPTPREEMRAGTHEAEKILRELDRSSAARSLAPAVDRLAPRRVGTNKK